jgi:hypothetical protein
MTYGISPVFLLCEHDNRYLIEKRNKLLCLKCHSFWDLDYYGKDYTYTSSYPINRYHFEKDAGLLKVKSLTYWLRQLSLDIRKMRVCEFGFGGGFCLNYLYQNAAKAFGIEIVEANIRHAASLGLPENLLFDFNLLPERLPDTIDLWIFQDSFEHIISPAIFTDWVTKNSSHSSRVLLVAPEANSISERILKDRWPHKLPDHKFHWSREGIIEFFQKRNYYVEASFFPLKFLLPKMIFAHAATAFRCSFLKTLGDKFAPKITIPFNIGEMGLLFRRTG